MKDFLLVANWKANLDIEQANIWLKDLVPTDLKVIICPSFPILGVFSSGHISNNISLGAQDVSVKDIGPFTGQVPAALLKNIAQYCLVGHSETRRLFGVTSNDIQTKISNLNSVGIKPILCGNFSELTEQTQSNYSDLILAFEPEESISTNPGAKALSVSEAGEKIRDIKKTTGCNSVLYGGSITVDNVADFYRHPDVNGVLVGKASTDISLFNQIISLCQ